MALLGLWDSTSKLALGKALPNFWRVAPKPSLWLAAGVVGALGNLYLVGRDTTVRKRNDIIIAPFLR